MNRSTGQTEKFAALSLATSTYCVIYPLFTLALRQREACCLTSQSIYIYESLLQSSFFVRLLVSIVPALLVVTPLAYISQKQEVVSRDDDNVMTTAMRFVGAAFIFNGSFANVTAWQGASSANSSLKSELASLSALSETILDYKQNDTLKDALSKITTYVQTIHDTELSKTGIKGFMVSNTGLQRKQRVKNAALGAPTEIKRDSAEQQALDIRSAIISIEEADVVNDRDLNRMLKQVDDFQSARRTRISGTWPLVPQVVISIHSSSLPSQLSYSSGVAQLALAAA